jgi:hypothetical protein
MGSEAQMSKLSQRRPYFTIMTFKIYLVGLVVLGFGIGLIYLGGEFPHYWGAHAGGDALINNLGALLVISVALGLIWELAGRRSFAREVLETFNISADVDKAGIRHIGTRWLQDPDWIELFNNARELEIFVAYGSTWRNAHLGQLQDIAKLNGRRINVYLADPTNESLIETLAKRFEQTTSDLRQRVIDTKDDFENLRVSGGAEIQVFYFRGDRVFSFYRFDNQYVMTLYRHAKGRSAMVPTLVCNKGGTFYDFLESELAAIKENSYLAQ